MPTEKTNPTNPSISSPNHQLAREFKHGDVVCVITKHEHNGFPRYSFSFYKEYKDREGTLKRSHWFSKQHLPALQTVTAEAEAWFDQEERKRVVTSPRNNPPR